MATTSEAGNNQVRGTTMWTRRGHRIDIGPKCTGCFQTATAIHCSMARGVGEVPHDARLTTTMLQLRESHNHSAIDCRTSEEVDDTCRRIEATMRGRRCMRILLGDFNHVLCEPTTATAQTTTQPVGPALRRYATTTSTSNRRHYDTEYTVILKNMLNMTVTNTFDEWWRDDDATPRTK